MPPGDLPLPFAAWWTFVFLRSSGDGMDTQCLVQAKQYLHCHHIMSVMHEWQPGNEARGTTEGTIACGRNTA